MRQSLPSAFGLRRVPTPRARRAPVALVALCCLSLAMLLVLPLMLLTAGAGTASARPGLYEAATPSHRIIVELAAPAALPAVQPRTLDRAPRARAVDLLQRPEAQSQQQRVQAQQAAFVQAMQSALPGARVATFINEQGQEVRATFSRLLNAVVVVPPEGSDPDRAMAALGALPQVLRVSRDWPHQPTLYTSLDQINADALWQDPRIGGALSAGRGIKIASMDGGIHHAAAMFDGAGYAYPEGYPRGDLANTNGKIIVSRAYFRSWDPPAEGDENSWPGVAGTSHGVHTSATAAGNPAVAEFGPQLSEQLSGVAPAAWLMSYRVFYASVLGNEGFYTTEGLRALEDLVADGADVVINSWGGGPVGIGGEYDALDTALINAARAGVFVAMSAGNAGPGRGTGDHPSDDYISVAALSTAGNISEGNFGAVAPQPLPAELESLDYVAAQFGALIEPFTEYGPLPLRSAAGLDRDNTEGCEPFAPGAFAGVAALIARGTCEFGLKSLHAEQAGAALVIIHNHSDGGDTPYGMLGGSFGEAVTIPVIGIGHGDGLALVDWEASLVTPGEVLLSTHPYQRGNTPNIVASFSSRGPGVGDVLKPDIAAPGVNIVAHGYAAGAEGEDRHLGYGQASGTSMAGPHIAGAGALVRQAHPDWSPAWIKSALMSTARFHNLYIDEERTVPAQPLDVGAGQVDLARAADPGLIFEPASLSFGRVPLGGPGVLKVKLTSVATHAQTFSTRTLDVSQSHTAPPPLSGLRVEPAEFSLEPGESTTLTFTWDSQALGSTGDHQGYVRLQSAEYRAHLPAWMRVAHAEGEPAADVLVIDNDGSADRGERNYSRYYTEALRRLGLSHHLWDADTRAGGRFTFPDPVELERYRAVIYFSGDNFLNANAGREIAPSREDLDRLVEYVNGGGHLLAFGQDLTDVFDFSFLLDYVLGVELVYDGIRPEQPLDDDPELILGMDGTPFAGMQLDISERGDGRAAQPFLDELGLHKDIQNDCRGPGMAGFCETVIRPTLRYRAPGALIEQAGYVGFAHRDQPQLERPGITFLGSAMVFGFGLEAVNDNTGYTRRSAFLRAALGWGLDEPQVQIARSPALAGAVSRFEAELAGGPASEGATFRWDFGDGTPPTSATDSRYAGHTYSEPGTYTVRVEVANAWGNRTVAASEVEIVSPIRRELRVESVAVGWNDSRGRVISTPPGIDCDTRDCRASFMDQASVVLVAEPVPGQLFAGWSGACSGRGTCTLVMDGDHQVSAMFYNQPGSAQ